MQSFFPLYEQRRIIGTLAYAVALFSLSGRFFGPLTPFIKTKLALSDVQIGLLSSAFLVGSLVSCFPAGSLVDRYDIRIAISLGVAVLGLAIGFAATRQKFDELLLVLLFAGAIRNIVGIAASVATTRFTAPRLWGTVTGVIRASGSTADLLAALLLPVVALIFGWAVALGFIGGLLFASAFALWSLLPASKMSRERDVWHVAKKGAIDRRVLMVSLLSSGYLMSLLAINSFFVLYLVEVLRISPVFAGIYLAVSQLMAVVGQVIWGVVGDRGIRYEKKGILSLLGIGTAIGLFALSALPVSPGVGVVLVVSTVLGLTALASWGVITALILDVADIERAGDANALFSTFVYSVGAMSPLLFGLIVEATDSYRIAFRLFAVITLGSALALSFLSLKPMAQVTG